MASSKKPLSRKVKASTSKKTKQSSLLNIVEKTFVDLTQSHKKIKSMTVALSGGIDSVVLLHILYQLQKQYRFKLNATHVHHGLSKNADKWVKFCEKLCAKLFVPLDVHHVKLPQKKSLGVEGEARRLRYEKLLQSKSDWIVLAHHEDDQAETFLLQLIRGAGVKGLSSMAQVDDSKGLWRPLLNISRSEIDVYAKKHKLKWIEDESNLNTDFDRNFIRHNILNVLRKRFSHIVRAISRSSLHLAEAQELLNDLAVSDLARHLKSDNLQNKLEVDLIRKLSHSRAKNVLRYWLEINEQLMPSKELLDELLRQVLTAKKDAELKIELTKDYEIRRYKDEIYIVRKNKNAQKKYEIFWNGESEINLPTGAKLKFKEVKGSGIALSRLQNKKLKITNQQAGQSLKLDHNRPTKTLKNLFQEAHIAPWVRLDLPLIFIGGDLVCVPHLGISSDMSSKKTDMGLEIELIH